MEYVGGGSVSNLLRNPDAGPVTGEVRKWNTAILLLPFSYMCVCVCVCKAGFTMSHWPVPCRVADP